ncbi:YL1 nuclear protein-domain-containing protein [Thelonectria olida]|uniref:YL1 nuclear protein-domain-containing protein n=1 Tax=Thelonectria olida TaxID=1576542 RepID=A0A9P9ASL0_9HYPO|nr:YL1 nuclear protein-domain-containing protein [Thelonectria olida]
MESEPKPSERDNSRSPELSSDSDSDSDTGNGRASNTDSQTTTAPKIEWLATTRQRRSTAGNRMKSMLANEEPDSDLELLFAEDENDQGFSDAGDDGSDMQMDSTDDEDENNNADDDEGEKELEKQAKERRAAQRKRRAQDAIPAKFRKKVRIDPTTPTTPAPAPAHVPRPKKKSERTSWLPSPADMPTRASSRKTTRMSKEQLHQQMVEREAKRLKQLAQMQKKAERLEALKKPPMTQEERLREAAIVEKRNSKSLNRWEEAEKQREEERRAKLAALNERTLKGPVITFWSGIGEWMGKNMVVEEAPKKKRERADKTKGKAKDKDKARNEASGPHVEGKEPAKEDSNRGNGPDGVSANASSDANPKPTPVTPSQVPHTSLQPPAPPAGASSTPTIISEGGLIVPVKVEEVQAKPADTPLGPEVPSPPEVEELPQVIKMIPPTPAPHGLAAPGLPPPSTTAGGLAAPTLAPPPSAATGGLTALAVTPTPPPPLPASLPATRGGLAAPVAAPAPIAPPNAQRSCLTPPPGMSRPPESKPTGVLAPPMLAPPPGITVNGASAPMLGLVSGSGSSKSNILAPPMTSQGPVPPTLASIAPPTMSNLPTPLAAPLPLLKPAPLSQIATPIPTSSPAPTTMARLELIPDPPSAPTGSGPPSQPPGPPQPSTGARRSIIFQNFDENAIKDKNVQTQIIFGRKMTKLAKPSHAPLCVITNHPARYRDPKTGLPYYNAHAYREIQRLCRNEFHFSKVLNAWVGNGAFAARGVPERFLNPGGKRSSKPLVKAEPGADQKPEEAKTTEVNMMDVSAPPAAKGPELRPAPGINVPIANPPAATKLLAPTTASTPAATPVPPRQPSTAAPSLTPIPRTGAVPTTPAPSVSIATPTQTAQVPTPQVSAPQAPPPSTSVPPPSASLAPATPLMQAPALILAPVSTPAKTSPPLAAAPPQLPTQTPPPSQHTPIAAAPPKAVAHASPAAASVPTPTQPSLQPGASPAPAQLPAQAPAATETAAPTPAMAIQQQTTPLAPPPVSSPPTTAAAVAPATPAAQV